MSEPPQPTALRPVPPVPPPPRTHPAAVPADRAGTGAADPRRHPQGRAAPTLGARDGADARRLHLHRHAGLPPARRTGPGAGAAQGGLLRAAPATHRPAGPERTAAAQLSGGASEQIRELCPAAPARRPRQLRRLRTRTEHPVRRRAAARGDRSCLARAPTQPDRIQQGRRRPPRPAPGGGPPGPAPGLCAGRGRHRHHRQLQPRR